MSTATASDAAGTLELRVSRRWLGLVVVASAAGVVTTIAALAAAPDRLYEGVTLSAVMIERLGLVRGMLIVGGIKVAGAVGAAQMAWLVGQRVEAVPGVLDGFSNHLRTGVYVFAVGWFVWLAVNNVLVLAGVLGFS